jgi:predicted hydrocarbon binding protein
MPFKVQRFEQSLAACVDDDVKAKLLEGCEAYDAIKSPAKKARWIKGLMERLEEEAGEAVAREVMVSCGGQCISRSLLKKVQKHWRESGAIDDFLDRLNQAHIGGGSLRREGDTIYGSYERCYCGSVSKAAEPVPLTYCYCSCGWYKMLFETVLERSVEVELLSSIAQGADACRFAIRI